LAIDFGGIKDRRGLQSVFNARAKGNGKHRKRRRQRTGKVLASSTVQAKIFHSARTLETEKLLSTVADGDSSDVLSFLRRYFRTGRAAGFLHGHFKRRTSRRLGERNFTRRSVAGIKLIASESARSKTMTNL